MSLKITETKARMLYKDSPNWFKKELENEFGSENLKIESFKNIKTFEDACKKLEVHPDDVFYDRDSPDEIAYKKLKVVIAAINNGWTPDWNNSNEKKWWPWFILSSGFGFSASSYGYVNAGTTVGSRLYFETKEKCDYCATQFIDLYRDLLTITE